MNAKGNPDGSLSHDPSLRNFRPDRLFESLKKIRCKTADFSASIERIFLRQLRDGSANPGLRAMEISGRVIDALRDDLHVLGAEAARRDCRGADAHAAGDEGALRIVGNGVFVDGDIVLDRKSVV